MTTADYLPILRPPNRLVPESTAIQMKTDGSKPMTPSRREARSDNARKRGAAEGNYKDFRPSIVVPQVVKRRFLTYHCMSTSNLVVPGFSLITSFSQI